MQAQQISLQQFVENLRVMVGESIWRTIHPADGWLIIDIGQKYRDTIPGKGGIDEPYDKGQFQLRITGDWEVYSGDKLIETRKVNDDNQKAYFDRMDKLVTNFPIKTIENIEFYDSSLIISGNGVDVRVPIRTDTDSISFTKVELSQSKEPIIYTHYRYEEKVGGLAKISTQ